MLPSDLTCLLSTTVVIPPRSTSTLSTGTATGTGKAVALAWKERAAAFVGWEGKVAAISTASCTQQIKNLHFIIILMISMGRNTPGSNSLQAELCFHARKERQQLLCGLRKEGNK